MQNRLVQLSLKRPLAVIIAVLLVTLAFATQFPKIKTDTDPSNMLPEGSAVRQSNREVEEAFGLPKDMIAVGIENQEGIFNAASLERLAGLTSTIAGLEGVAPGQTMGLLTAGGFALPADGELKELMVESFRETVMGNPVMVERFISTDEKTTAIYAPLKEGANGKEIADSIRLAADAQQGPERYYIAGDPVARDTFGSEMFKQMGLFSPIAGLIMMLVLYLMFRSWPLTFSIMGVAMISIVWTLGLLIGLGHPVHIMSSMIPVFLMAISTASIHIFNEFYFCCGELPQRRQAILKTMQTVGTPVLYTALAAAVGFGVLGIGEIIPVRVFGLFVAFGIAAIVLLSFTFLPAVMVLIKEKSLRRASRREEAQANSVSLALGSLGRWAIKRRRLILVGGLILMGFSLWGMSQIRINNNMVAWFKSDSEIRVADRVINDKLGGSSLAYLVAQGTGDGSLTTPAAMKYLDGLQEELETLAVVGNTYSAADAVKMANMMANRGDPLFFVVPEANASLTQLLTASMRPSDLNRQGSRANVQVQLKSWDASAMDEVLAGVERYQAAQPATAAISFMPAGIAYFNKVWNDEVLGDVLKVFAIGTLVIFLVLLAIFRSLKWAIVSYLPLVFTIVLIYGGIGLMGKDFDMPISVLSTLSLGLAVDFAIHFVRRYRQRLAEDGDIESALVWTVQRPGKGIVRNAVLFSAAFSVMIFAALTPYITVGIFISAIMLVSAAFTLIYLPALIRQLNLR